MAELFHNLHIEWPLILAQAVNFLLLLFILTKLLYKPLIARLNERQKIIRESLERAEAMEKKVEQFRSYQQEQLARMRADAQKIIETGHRQGEKEKAGLVESAKKDIEALIARAHGEIKQQKEEMIRSAQAQMAQILVPALEKILTESMDVNIRKELMVRATQKIKEAYPKKS